MSDGRHLAPARLAAPRWRLSIAHTCAYGSAVHSLDDAQEPSVALRCLDGSRQTTGVET
jgi:hypothetical protein